MNLVSEMLLASPAPAVIWAILMLLTFPALLLLSSPDGESRPGPVGGRRRDRDQFERPRDEATRAARYAEEVYVAAERARLGAQRWQQVRDELELGVEEAWRAWLDADTRLRVGLTAAAWGRPWSVRTCEEYAARERFLHRTVAAAVSRGELPAAAIADAVAGRDWDARLHPVEQELVVARAAAAHLRERYEQALAAQQTAWHDADLARRNADTLHREALLAAEQAAQLIHRLPAAQKAQVRTSPRPVVTAAA
ncbi:hypothetical protein GCM10010172_68020 [Paractinoplanes ferrugineus]|uniref:Uncharacterized protein n=1 Tax=Paractinoplanes ferrugineus TaxID=113564 RepID=A0A919JAK2_9ACTN|nr:hypothetical protein [Actinoplanes ferrugineus]GIE16544.1 hypothetical protein Afe05nite_83840 [Actinoplanes ferrugineus]